MGTLQMRVRIAAAHAGYRSQAQLAREMGIARSYLSQIVLEQSRSPKRLRQLADLLGVTVEWIVDGTTEVSR
jgi:transcriptional regulator with XRE-family HTH domain